MCNRFSYRSMDGAPKYIRSADELSGITKKLSKELISSSNKLLRLCEYQVTLIEIFTNEQRILEKLGYCDFELGYVAYETAIILSAHCKHEGGRDTKSIVLEVEATLEKKRNVVAQMVENLQSKDELGGSSSSGEDELVARFQGLKRNKPFVNNGEETKHRTDRNIYDLFKERKIVTAEELYDILYREQGGDRVLLVDYRTKKEFDYNHIKFPDIINIDPRWVVDIWTEGGGDPSKIDFPSALALLLKEDEVARFSRKQNYEMIVVYNLSYGWQEAKIGKFEMLKRAVISGSSDEFTTSPFDRLIDLLLFGNRYLASQIKRRPCILLGGATAWFEAFGKEYIEKSAPKSEQIIVHDQASQGNTKTDGLVKEDIESEKRKNPTSYLKNFGEYLSSAKQVSTKVPDVRQLQPRSVSSSPRFFIGSPVNGVRPPSRPQSDQKNVSVGPPTVDKPHNITSSEESVISSTEQKVPSRSHDVLQQKPEKAQKVNLLSQYATGLTNLGNSCYMNCIVQSIGATIPLLNFFFPDESSLTTSRLESQASYYKHINFNNELGSKGKLTINFVRLLRNMLGKSGNYYVPSDFKKLLGTIPQSVQFGSFDQQDCIEFLDFLLDTLHEDLNQRAVKNSKEKKLVLELTPDQEKIREVFPVRLASTIEWERYLKLNFSVVVDYFQGQLLSQLRCLECGLTSTTYNAVLILSLPIPEKLSSSYTLLLDDCLREFTTTELLDDKNKWHCPKCKRFTKLTKKIIITRLPPVLIIHFKRFQISSKGTFSKLNNLIRYPVNQVLDLTGYWPSTGTAVNSGTEEQERITKDKEEQILASLPTRNQVPPFKYELYGVVNHFGNLSTGHYTSYIKKLRPNGEPDWCYYDDARVTHNCKESDVMNKNAYCLFYRRI